jgi:AraC-like DNA-binding protein
MPDMRAVTLSNYVEIAAAVGLDAYWMLRHAGIPPSALEDPENRLPAKTVLGLLEHSARRSGCECFGLLMAQSRSFASLGPLSLLLERVGNLREVVGEATTYRRQMNDVILLEVADADGTALVHVDLLPQYAGIQATDYAVGVAYVVLAGASGGQWSAASVHLMREAPEDSAIWRRFFATPVEFQSTFNGFACTSTSLDEPIPLADAKMADNARRLLDLVVLPPTGALVTDRASRAITSLLPSGQFSLQAVAAKLSLSPRALQRQLEAEGQSFAQLLREVRRDLARNYLASSAQSITTVSEQLGYASPSAFTRWFSGEFGSSPQTWRRAQREPQAVPPQLWKV